MFNKFYPILILIFICFYSFGIMAQSERNLISKGFTEDKVKNILLSKQDWHPFPKISEIE